MHNSALLRVNFEAFLILNIHFSKNILWISVWGYHWSRGSCIKWNQTLYSFSASLGMEAKFIETFLRKAFSHSPSHFENWSSSCQDISQKSSQNWKVCLDFVNKPLYFMVKVLVEPFLFYFVCLFCVLFFAFVFQYLCHCSCIIFTMLWY